MSSFASSALTIYSTVTSVGKRFPIVGQLFGALKDIEKTYRRSKDNDNAASARRIVEMIIPVLGRYVDQDVDKTIIDSIQKLGNCVYTFQNHVREWENTNSFSRAMTCSDTKNKFAADLGAISNAVAVLNTAINTDTNLEVHQIHEDMHKMKEMVMAATSPAKRRPMNDLARLSQSFTELQAVEHGEHEEVAPSEATTRLQTALAEAKRKQNRLEMKAIKEQLAIQKKLDYAFEIEDDHLIQELEEQLIRVKDDPGGPRIKFNNETLKAAAKEWCTNSSAAEAKYGDIRFWDTSEVTSMRNLFRADSDGAGEAAGKRFNADISRWDVSNVTDMFGMFYKCESFNSDLSSWNVGKVTSMQAMFSGASSFNSDLSSWNVGKVTNMWYMFEDASSFNKDTVKKNWDLSGTKTNWMFGVYGY
ncbi:hypothetical protein TrST_g11230 [Triparma strigata]|uniref:Uncharacterized protein n=1 Tax=Triparma strigata TaxID=1606541 RepID=A0A9W7EKD6_9STRA|nr:hypothetical protein TrST_g11230 [Triparma strigata]